MRHGGTKRLETERLILRPFKKADGEAMYRNWASDPEVTKFLTWPNHADPMVSLRIAARWEELNPRPDNYQWAIVLRELGEPIGSISVVRIDEDVDGMEIGYCIGRKWWNKGIMTEAAREVIRYLFTEVGAKRIAGRHDVANPASGRVMRKLGMKKEGVLRQADRNNQGIVDVVYRSILFDEWQKKQEKRLKREGQHASF